MPTKRLSDERLKEFGKWYEDLPTDHAISQIVAEVYRLRPMEKQLEEVSAQLEHDRSLVADCLTKALKEISSRDWLTTGHGFYVWDDDRWHEEFQEAGNAIRKVLEPLAKVAADWSGAK